MKLEIIHKAVCNFYYMDNTDQLFIKNVRGITERRQVFYYFACLLTKLNLSDIGQYSKSINGNTWNHSSVLYSRNKIKGFIDVDRRYKENMNVLKLLIKHSDREHIERKQTEMDVMRIVMNSKSKKEMITNLSTYIESVK